MPSSAPSDCRPPRRRRCATSRRAMLDGRLELDRLDELTDDEARVQLTAVRGIGSWTADMFLLVQLGRPDVLPAGDLGIRHAVGAAYDMDRVPTEIEVRGIGEAWRPHRSLATAYLYSSLSGRPGVSTGQTSRRTRVAPGDHQLGAPGGLNCTCLRGRRRA